MNQELGRSIRRLREMRGLKRTHVATAIKVTHPQIGRWERGENRPLPKNLLAIALTLAPTTGEYDDWQRLLAQGESQAAATEIAEWFAAHPYDPTQAHVPEVPAPSRPFRPQLVGARASEPDAGHGARRGPAGDDRDAQLAALIREALAPLAAQVAAQGEQVERLKRLFLGEPDTKRGWLQAVNGPVRAQRPQLVLVKGARSQKILDTVRQATYRDAPTHLRGGARCHP